MNVHKLPPTELSQHWSLRKPAITSDNGLVASQHLAASQIGANVLHKGGNAIDAAIATSFAISVIEPWMSGIGGGGLMTYYDAATKKVSTIHFGMKSPAGLNPTDFEIDEGAESGDLFSWPAVKGDINVSGWKAIGVPGLLSGIDHAHRRWATMPWQDLVMPAVELARQGLPVSWSTTLRIAAYAAILREDPMSAQLFLPNGLPPSGVAGKPIPHLPLGLLSTTLETIARDGIEPFYNGTLGKSLVEDVRKGGGYLSMKDMQDYQAEECEPLSFAYRDKVIHTMGGVTAGPSMKMAMEQLPTLSKSDHPQPNDVAEWAKALKASYTERFARLGDVDDTKDPACTTHITIVDGQGNMVALTQTLLSLFGAKVSSPSSGVVMNNGMMWFDPVEGRPNSIAPSKKPLSNMAPTIVTTKDDQPVLAIGASGGRRIFPCIMQLLSMVLDFDMDLDNAIHAPRIDVSGIDGASVDPRFNSQVLDTVGKVLPAQWMEHAVVPSNYACPSIVQFDNGKCTGVADPLQPLSGVAG